MTAWHQQRMLALDFETTGISTDEDRIVTAAAYRVGGGQPIFDRDWLVDPGIEIPAGATAIHKITTERARTEGIPAAEAVKEIAHVVALAVSEGLPIVGHNVGLYDLPLLDAECRRHLGGTLTDICGRPVAPVIDTRVLDQHVIKKRKKTDPNHGPRTLRTTALVYGLTWDDDNAHGAAYDALQAARVAWHIGNIAHSPAEKRPRWVYADHRFDDLAGLTLAELHERQIGWAREQARSLQAFLRSEDAGEKRDPEVVIDGRWPLKAAP